MIQRVYEQALQSTRLGKVVIATDDDRILKHVQEFNGEVVMTAPHHLSGTDRCAEVIRQDKDKRWDVAINIQGDEPYIQPEQIDLLCSCFKRRDQHCHTGQEDRITRRTVQPQQCKSGDEQERPRTVLQPLSDSLQPQFPQSRNG